MSRLLVATLTALSIAPLTSVAQTYPSKPVRIIAPFPPGGGVDVYARMLAQELTPILGQPFIVENKSGASGNIGTDFVAKSVPDGYTLLLHTNAFAINASVYGKLAYDPINDLAPVSVLGSVPLVLAVASGVPAKNLQDLLELAKSRKLAYSSCGNGTAHHLAGELFKSMTKADLTHVPYKGCAPAIADTAGGQVEVSFNTIPNTMPHVGTGKLRAIAVTTKARSSLAPDVPSLQELGLAGYDVDQWFGFFTTAKTPRPVIDRLNEALKQALARPEMSGKLVAQGVVPTTSTPEAFGALVRGDIERWGRLAKSINLKAD